MKRTVLFSVACLSLCWSGCSGDKETTYDSGGALTGDDDDVFGDDDDDDDDDTTETDTGTTTEGGEDADGDGVEAPEDCDDDDDAVYPGASETACNELDNDCDGEIDEDVPPDSVESNDPAGSDLGDLTGDTFELSTYLTPEGDQDTFLFYSDDGTFDIFGITIYVIAPNGIDVAVELYWLPNDGTQWELIDSVDDAGPGFNEELVHDGAAFSDDAGLYRIEITGEGASCSDRYDLRIEA